MLSAPRVTGVVVVLSLGGSALASTDSVILEWNLQLLQTIRETGGIPTGFPGPVSRNIAIAWVAGIS